MWIVILLSVFSPLSIATLVFLIFYIYHILSKQLETKSIQWKWKQRAETLVNKSARILDILTFGALAIFTFLLPLSSGFSFLDAVPYVIIMYTFAWLCFYAFYMSPILVIERISRAMYSFGKKGCVTAMNESKKTLTNAKDQSVSWVKSGFDE